MDRSTTVVGLGELLWDEFPDARRPGGAPANVAFHAQQIGHRGLVASRVGCDKAGEGLVAHLADHALDTRYVQRDPLHPTGRVTVELAQADHPQYVIHEEVAWDYLEPLPVLIELMSSAAAVAFGTLAQRSPVTRATIHRCLDSTAGECLRVYDVNLRQQWYQRRWIEDSLARSTIVKLNESEAGVLTELLELEAVGELPDFGRRLIERYGVELVCVTRGAAGCLLVSGAETVDIPGRQVTAVDAVGAGDAFTAALVSAQLRNWPLACAGRLANDVGGLVVARQGAMPDLSAELPELIARHQPA